MKQIYVERLEYLKTRLIESDRKGIFDMSQTYPDKECRARCILGEMKIIAIEWGMADPVDLDVSIMEELADTYPLFGLNGTGAVWLFHGHFALNSLSMITISKAIAAIDSIIAGEQPDLISQEAIA